MSYMCCAVSEFCSPDCGLVIYGFEMAPLLHSTQMSLNTSSIAKSPQSKWQFDLSAPKGAQWDLQKERLWIYSRLHLVKSGCSGRADDFDNAVGGAPVQLRSSMWSRWAAEQEEELQPRSEAGLFAYSHIAMKITLCIPITSDVWLN